MYIIICLKSNIFKIKNDVQYKFEYILLYHFNKIIITIINLRSINIVNRLIGNINLMKLFYLYEFHVRHSVSQMTSA